MLEELLELVPDCKTWEDGVVDQGGPQVCQGSRGVKSRILESKLSG